MLGFIPLNSSLIGNNLLGRWIRPHKRKREFYSHYQMFTNGSQMSDPYLLKLPISIIDSFLNGSLKWFPIRNPITFLFCKFYFIRRLQMKSFTCEITGAVLFFRYHFDFTIFLAPNLCIVMLIVFWIAAQMAGAAANAL